MGIEEETDRTLFIRNLDARVTEELLFELFLQVLFPLKLTGSIRCTDSITHASTSRAYQSTASLENVVSFLPASAISLSTYVIEYNGCKHAVM